MKNVAGGVEIGHLVTVLDVTLEDVDQILNVHTSIALFLQPHCVAQDQRQNFPAFPSPDGVGTELRGVKHNSRVRVRSASATELVHLHLGVRRDTWVVTLLTSVPAMA